MPPVVQAIVSFVASSIFAITGSSVLAAYASLATLAVANFAIKAVATIGLSRLLGPKGPKAQQTERQADILNLTLGETAREAIFGTAATGGSLMDAFNHGANNEWEVQVVAVADHECDGLVGFFVNDTFVSFVADGVVAGYNNNLQVFWKNGAPGQTALSYLVTNSGGRWTSNDVATGVAFVVYAYKFDEKTWPSGRPTFRAVVRGAKLYDPRKDSTVPGGSGAHRWGTPSTYEWSENAAICRYNYQRGIFTNGQLVIGAGRSADEAPPEAVIGPANICDELVALKAGGTERRYRVGGVVRADETWLSVEEDFAAAMAGDLVERSGALFIDPGASKSSVFSFTDADLVFDQPVTVQAKVSRRDLVNTVAAAYIEPSRLWQSTSAPLRRSLADITADGEVRERPLDLRFVTSQTQAQRLGEIERRKMRLQRTASVVLGPAAAILEAGDWITWTSARYAGGQARTFQIVGVGIDERLQTSLQLREMNANVFAWTAATDELDLLSPAYTAPGALPAATIAGFNATAVSITGAGGSAVPAISVTWTAPTDPSIYGITFEWRKVGDTNTLKATHLRPQDGTIVLAGGITSTVDFEVRAIPETDPERDETPTAWRTVTSTALAAATAGSVGSVLWGNVSGRPANLAALTGSEAINNALVPFGVNAVANSEFAYADTYPPLGWGGGGNGAAASQSFSINIANGRRSLKTSLAGSPAAGIYLDAAYSNGGGSVDALQRFALPVLPGDLVGASWWIARNASVSDAYTSVAFYTVTGAYITEMASTERPTIATNGDSNDQPNNYSLSRLVVTAPANARFAITWPRGLTSGGATPTIWATQPMLARLAPGQTAVPPYSPSPADRRADVTASNVASGFTGQGPLATRSSVDFATSDVTNRTANNISYTAGGTVDSLRPGEAGANVTETRNAAGFAGQGPWATTTTALASVLAPAPNLFPFPSPIYNIYGGTTPPPSSYGWAGTTAPDAGYYQAAGGPLYIKQYFSGGAARTDVYYFDVPNVIVGSAYTASLSGYATNASQFSPYIEFLDAARSTVLAQALMSVDGPSGRWKATLTAPSGAAWFRLVVRGIFPSSGSYQDIVWSQIKLEFGSTMTPFSSAPEVTPRQSGADVTASNVSSGFAGQGSMATQNANGVAITGGSININGGRFVVNSDGSVTISNAASGARLEVTSSVIRVYDASNVLRVRLGIW